MKKTMIVFVVLLISLLTVCEASADLQNVSFEYVNYPDLAMDLIRYMNEYRTSGQAWQYDENNNRVEIGALPALTIDPNLCVAAQQRALEQYFGLNHTRPDGSSWYTILEGVNGENLSYTTGQDPKWAFTRLLEEDKLYDGQGHRRNMLDNLFTNVGVGCIRVNGRNYWAMLFADVAPVTPYKPLSTDDTGTITINTDTLKISTVLNIPVENLRIDFKQEVPLPGVTVGFHSDSGYYPPTPVVPADILWTSSDPSVVSVDNGKVRGLKVGNITLTVTAMGLTGTVTATVLPCTHPSTYEEILTESDCLTAGEKKIICSTCQNVRIEQLPLGSHRPGKPVTQMPTCTEAGQQRTLCNLCLTLLEEMPIPATGHSSATEVAQEPTCTVPGSTREYCLTCNETLSISPIPVKDHTPEKQTIEATCTAEGATLTVCSVCHTELGRVVIPATAHNTTILSKEPTCDQQGYEKVVCTVCNTELGNRTLPMLGHTPATTTVEPTCILEGYTQTTCSLCQSEISRTILPAKGHAPATEQRTIQATCFQDGRIEKICPVCNDVSEYTVIPASHASTSVQTKWLPDCVHPGLDVTVCDLCGTELEQIEIPIQETHSAYTYIVVPATCDLDGFECYICTECYAMKDRVDMPATGHSLQMGIIKNTGKEEGRKIVYCENCSYNTEDPAILASLFGELP